MFRTPLLAPRSGVWTQGPVWSLGPLLTTRSPRPSPGLVSRLHLTGEGHPSCSRSGVWTRGSVGVVEETLAAVVQTPADLVQELGSEARPYRSRAEGGGRHADRQRGRDVVSRTPC